MVKVKEFCCGCSLRSGTFTIAWGTLMYNCFLFATTIYTFFLEYRQFAQYNHLSSSLQPPSTLIFVYNIIRTISGISVSITALWALHKNKVQFLNGLFWYLCYVGAAFTLDEILLIFKPNWEMILAENNIYILFYNYENIENIVTFLILYLLMTGVVSYGALIVKSYRDYSMRNDAQNVEFVGPDATTVGYLAA